MGTAVDRNWRFVSGRTRRPKPMPPVRVDSAPPEKRRSQSSDGSLSPRGTEESMLWRSARWTGDASSPALNLIANSAMDKPSPILSLKFQHLGEQKRYTELAQAIRQTVSLKEIAGFIDSFPIDDLIHAVPKTLSLLEAIYSKFYLCERRGFPRELLKPEKLLSQMLWWAAQQASGGSSASESRVGAGAKRRPEAASALGFDVMAPHVRTLLRMIDAAAPLATLALHRDRDKLNAALEGLGLHGLVNCGQNKLIEVTDAVRIELSTHLHQMKLTATALDKLVSRDPRVKEPMTMFLYSINGKGKAPAPTASSHQRLMKLRLSDVRERLARNRGTLACLTRAVRAADLEALARILEKRVSGDEVGGCEEEAGQGCMDFEALLDQFSALLRDPNPAFAIASPNPVVAEVLVHFKGAYERILGLLPAKELEGKAGSLGRHGDSGFGEDDDSSNSESPLSEHTEGTGSSYRSRLRGHRGDSEDRDTFVRSKSGRLLGPVAALIEAKAKRFGLHRSLGDFSSRSTEALEEEEVPAPPFPLTPSRSLHNLHLALPTGPHKDRMWGYGSGGESSNSGDRPASHLARMENRRLQAEVQRLHADLQRATDHASRLEAAENSSLGRERRLFGVEPAGGGGAEPGPALSAAVERYGRLFAEDRGPLMAVLDTLPELRGAQDLQMKILFTVLILSFRSISEVLEEGWGRVEDALKIPPLPVQLKSSAVAASDKHTAALKNAVYAFLQADAKSAGGMRNAKEVTRQIWETLFDFPSLQTCTAFNRFILECVDVGWALSAAAAGAVRLSFEDSELEPSRHLRFHSSSLRSTRIQRFLWPALLLHSKTPPIVLAKAVVLT